MDAVVRYRVDRDFGWFYYCGQSVLLARNSRGGTISDEYTIYWAEVSQAGHLYLPVQPSPQLLAQPNPWDPAVDASLKPEDMVLSEGAIILLRGSARSAPVHSFPPGSRTRFFPEFWDVPALLRRLSLLVRISVRVLVISPRPDRAVSNGSYAPCSGHVSIRDITC